MIADVSQSQGETSDYSSNGHDGSLEEQTNRLMTTEIAFIANQQFKKMNRSAAKHVEEARQAILSSASLEDANSGRTRLPAHLERLCATPLLSREEEQTLFCRMNFLKYRANMLRSKLKPSKPSEEAIAQIEELVEMADQVRNQICSANTRLVISIVKKFADERYTFDDLLSEGIGCLIRTIDKFDFDRGFRFSTYVTMAVRREVFRAMQRRRKRDTRFVTGADLVLDQELNDQESLDRSEIKLSRINDTLGDLMSHLEDREQFIVKARYGFDDLGAKPTFSKLGEYLGVSKERVRQLENRAINKLRSLMDESSMKEQLEIA